MASNSAQLVQMFRHSLESQGGSLALQSDRARDHVFTKYATGNGNINDVFSLDIPFRLVFIRCHFSGGAGTATLNVAIDSFKGATYDTRLASLTNAGANNDVFFIPGGAEVSDPSAWVFQSGDTVNLKWTNPAPGVMTWGLEVGLAIAA